MPVPPASSPDDGELELAALVDYLQRTRGLDLSGYKRPGLLRRLTKRLRAAGVTGFAAYIDYLESHPTEYVRLLDTLLINVTSFFRDDLPWEYVRAEVIPRIVAQKASTDPIRVWCAGCATGEEAYTLAIVLAEAVGEDAFRERVKIYATDLDEAALGQARQGVYTERDVADLPPELVDRYFERREQSFAFRKDLRRAIIFGRNDLMQYAPISRVDLLACRNTLMYFDTATQAKILARFHFALVDSGFLLLGRAETIQTHGTLFTPVDLRRRVFTKAPGPSRLRPPLNARTPLARLTGGDQAEETMRLGAFDAGVVAQFVVDRAGRLALVNATARGLFKLGTADIGRPLQDLEVSYRPYELRSVIEQALADHQPVTRDAVPWRAPGGEQRWFDIAVSPLVDGGGAELGASVSFVEVTRLRHVQQQLEDSQTELETAYQELQSTNEELETTNEELHSTVEELETTNEELQSTNEELQTINDELRTRSDELNQANAFLESVFTSLRAGVAVLDRELRVLVWNRQAEELWGVRAEEAEGAHLLNLDIGLPVGQLMPAIRAALAGDAAGRDLHLPATNRRGRTIVCQTRVFPLVSRASDQPHGVIVLMEERPAEERPAEERPAEERPAPEGEPTA